MNNENRSQNNTADSAQSTGDMQLSEVFRKIRRDGFNRYHAKRQALFDCRVTTFGFIIYLVTAYSVYKEQGFSNLAPLSPLFMSLMCINPVFLHGWAPETYYKIRDWYFIFHFWLHHVYAPQELERLGCDLKQYITSPSHPVVFFAGALLSRTVIWQALNVLMYRLRIKTFLIAQPFILATVIPFEVSICTFLNQMHPKLTKDVYGTIGEYGRLLSATTHPVFLLFDQDKTLESLPSSDPEAVCRQVHFFLIVFFGYMVPGIIIWRLEKQSWRHFLSLSAEQVAWPGSPDRPLLSQAMAVLREDEADKAEGENSGFRFAVLVAMLAAVLWRMLEYAPMVTAPK